MDKNDNNLNSIFFSKNLISSLNKILLKECNLYNINRDGKQEIINILIKNMKLVYKSIDSDKINNNNFNSIFEQFKKHSIIEASNEINHNNILNTYQNTASDIKFNRDFNSTSSDGNKFFDRPQSTKSINNFNSKKVNIQNISTNIPNQIQENIIQPNKNKVSNPLQHGIRQISIKIA